MTLPPISTTIEARARAKQNRQRWLVPSIEIVLFVLLFWQTLYFMPQMLNADGDLGLHLTVGEHILTAGAIPTQDLFTHTVFGAKWIPHEWLSEILFALVHRAAGLDGVAVLTTSLIASAYAALSFGLRKLGVRALVAFAGGYTAAVVGSIHHLPRPHLFTILFFSFFLIALEKYRRTDDRRVLYALPALMLIWANLHGVFFAGLVLVLMYIAGALLDRERHRAADLMVLFIGLVLASGVNPAGLALLTHTVGFLQSRYILEITTEYQSPNFHQVSALPFAALVLFSLILGWRARRQLNWTESALLVGWTAAALYTARNVPLYALAAVIVLAPIADEWIQTAMPAFGRTAEMLEPTARAAGGWLWAPMAIVLFGVLLTNGVKVDLWSRGNVFDGRAFPIAAVDALGRDLPDGKMFNEFAWGGYLLHRLYPQRKVFIDGRTDFYGEALTRKYLRALAGEAGWEQVLDEYDVRWVIVQPSRPLAERLDASPQWGARYRDETTGVWVRK